MVAVVFMALTCSSVDTSNACPTPVPGSAGDEALRNARLQAGFSVLYPCQLPQVLDLTSSSVTGLPGRKQVELVFSGTFELALRQAQYPPAIPADPAGTSHVQIDLFPNVTAELSERYDGSRKAQYHLLWNRDGIFYEVQAVGPPLQRQIILDLARSLSDGSPPGSTATPAPTSPLATPTPPR